MIKYILLILLIFLSSIALARDINLDEIYIKRSSYFLKKLIFKKLDTYEKVNAVLVDRDIIFSGWISGERIIYIKETSGNINIIYRYHTLKQKREEIIRLKGLVTYSHIGWNGKYVFLKRLIRNDGSVPYGERLILNIRSGKVSISQTASPFMDFSIPVSGNSLVYESKNGFVEFFPGSGIKKLILRRSRYTDIVNSPNLSIAYLSPDRRKILVINGGGGIYNGKIIQDRRSYRIHGISSATELCWIDNNNLLFRKGSAGNFSAVIYNIKSRRSRTLIRNSLNTNVSFSYHPKIISILKDQIIMLYSIDDRRLLNIGLEGEDISFDPNASFFTSLIFKKLFIVNLNRVKRRRIELRRCWTSLLEIYNDLKRNSRHFENEYSIHYVKRKIDIYKKLLSK